MRSVKIVATLGPATSSRERIEQLVRAGVDVVRLNFSHGTHQEHAERVRIVREVSDKLGKPVAVLQDLQGPRIRTGPLKDGKPIPLETSADLTIAVAQAEGRSGTISTTYPDLYRHVSSGSRILLDDGRLEVQVVDVAGRDVRCRVVKGGLLGANKGINVPGVDLGIASFTEKDRDDLEFGLGLGMDWVAMSFVRSGGDIRPVKEALGRRHARIPLIAKIELPEALEHLTGILDAFDGIMVARGDLGVELSPEEVPVWQKEMVHRARRKGKVAIVATQMLESMLTEPRPTRAEVSDVANAVLDGADAVMLSGETAVGEYPVETVSVMARITARAQDIYRPMEVELGGGLRDAEAVAQAACGLARDLEARAIVVLTRSGMTARLVSKHRPGAPILALSRDPAMAQQLALWWGVQPVITDFPSNTEEAVQVMESVLLERGLAQRGDQVVVVASTPFTRRSRTNFLKVHRITGGA